MDQLQQNHFALFQLPTQFEIDTALLDQHYRALQSEVHPDRFASAPSHERMKSMQLATQANEAYRTLKDTTARARYLLQLKGIETLEESNTAMPADFLMLQMEWREAIEDATHAKDINGLDALLIDIKNTSARLTLELAQAFKSNDLDLAAQNIRKLSFIDKITTDIHRNLDTLDN